jgi:acetyltransferase-like isoleucine patch superfamily enzyme
VNSGVARLLDVLADAARPLGIAVRATMRWPLRFARLVSLRAQSNGHVPVSTQFDGPVTAAGTGELRLGEHCRLGRDVHFDTVNRGTITLGAHVRVNAGCIIAAGCEVSIGEDTLIGEYASIRDANHGMADSLPIRSQPLVAAPIRIGRDVWIGRGACILQGVTVGDGAVIGANSVVTRDVAAHAIHAGAPAREIGHRPSPAASTAREEALRSTEL